MKERPILFSAPMVRAILEGKKTQTRRILSYGNSLVDGHRGCKRIWDGLDFNDAFVDPGPSPMGNPGPYLKVKFPAEGSRHRIYPTWIDVDRLWVKEAWRVGAGFDHLKPSELPQDIQVKYGESSTGGKWRNAMFMPRWASRVTLEIVSVRVERLQNISEEDAIAEGVDSVSMADVRRNATFCRRDDFAQLWEKINGKGSWELNPWVWAIEFRRN